jgi:hypothetical protein
VTVRALVTVVLAVVAAMLAGCAPPAPRTAVRGPEIPITDMTSVSGKWGGLVTGLPGPPDGDWVDLVIQADGSYSFASYRTGGAALGAGKLTLKDGKLVTEGPRASATFSLRERQGAPILVVEGVQKTNGLPFTAELIRAR